MTNNVIFFASGGARDGVGNLLLAAQKGLPQTAEAKRKVNRGEGKTCRVFCVRIGVSNTALLTVLFSSQICSPPSFLIFRSLPTHPSFRDAFWRCTTCRFSSELDFGPTEVCVSPEEGPERTTSESQRKDNLASGRASIINPNQDFFLRATCN